MFFVPSLDSSYNITGITYSSKSHSKNSCLKMSIVVSARHVDPRQIQSASKVNQNTMQTAPQKRVGGVEECCLSSVQTNAIPPASFSHMLCSPVSYADNIPWYLGFLSVTFLGF